MQLSADRLGTHLESSLLPVYLLCGDEPLQKTEALDAIAARARQQDCERQSLFVDARFNWQDFSVRTQNVGMFSTHQLVALYFNKVPDKTATRHLNNYLKSTTTGQTLVIHCPKLDQATKNSKWYKQVDQLGAIVTVYPVSHQNLPKWIAARVSAMGMRLGPEAIQMIAYRTEGNLLAAHQTLQRLQLVAQDGQISDMDTISEIATDMGRYQVFDAVDSALQGQAENCMHRVERLKNQGVQATAVLHALLREVRILSASFDEVERGVSLSAALQSKGVWRSRLPLMQKAYKRHTANGLQNLLRHAHHLDKAAKGVEGLSPWHVLNRLVLRLAGVRIDI